MTQPAPFQIQHIRYYHSYEVEDTEDEGIGAVLLIPLDKAHKNDGSFQITIFNVEEDAISTPAADIFTPLPAVLEGSILHSPAMSAKELILEDCTAGAWSDVIDSIRDV